MTKPVIVKRGTKGSHLTFTELDQNFQNLDDATITLKADAGGTDVVSDLNGTITLDAVDGISITGNNSTKVISLDASLAQDTTPQLGGDLDVNGHQIISASNGNIQIEPNGTGKIILDGLSWPTSDGQDRSVLTTDGAGNLSLEPVDNIRLNAVSAESVATIYKGNAVIVSGSSGSKVTVSLASNTSELGSAQTIGLAAQDMAPGAGGYVICQGLLKNVNTSSFAAGDALYLGAINGSITNVKPYAPNNLVYLGTVEVSGTGNGRIFVKVQNGYELEELHNVNINHNVALANGHTLVYNSSNQLWENKLLSTDVVSDTTPQLGGDLDVNGYKIVSASSGNITIEPNGTGQIQLAAPKIVVGKSGLQAPITSNGTGQLIFGVNNNFTDNTIEINNSGVIEVTTKPTGDFIITNSDTTPRLFAGWSGSLYLIYDGVAYSTRRCEGQQSYEQWYKKITDAAGTTTYAQIKMTKPLAGGNGSITLEAEDVYMSSTATGYSRSIDRSGSSASYANGATVDFSNFSGMIIVNNTGSTGQIMTCICGGGSVAVLGYSGTGTPHKTGTITSVSGINGYRWTNDSGATDTFSFVAIRTRTSG